MFNSYPAIVTKVHIRSAGNEAGEYSYPQVLKSVTGILYQDKDETCVVFDITYPELETQLPVHYYLKSNKLDLEYFITEDRVIELAENDLVLKGCYVHFKHKGGFENWEFAARIAGQIYSAQIQKIECPLLSPGTKEGKYFMEMQRPAVLKGCLRFLQAEPDADEFRLIRYDVQADLVQYETNQLVLRFNFQPPGATGKAYYEKAITGTVNQNHPFFKQVSIFRVANNQTVMHAVFALPNAGGEVLNAWEVIGKFEGTVPEWARGWDVRDT